MKKAHQMTIRFSVAVLVMATGQVFGLTEFNDGGTYDIGSTIIDDVWIDYQVSGMGTTVNLLAGSWLTAPYQLRMFENGRINIYDGSMMEHEAWLRAHNSSQVNIFGGELSYFEMHDYSKINVSGGSITGNIESYGDSQISISNGSVTHLFVRDMCQVDISGGSITYARFWNNSQVHMSGGTIVGVGVIGLIVEDSSTMTIYGSDFAVDGQSLEYGVLTSVLGGSSSSEPLRHLTGTLNNGDSINNDFLIGNDAKIILIPEPCTFLLLGIGGMLIRKR